MRNGSLSLDGNQTLSVKAKGSLTVRPTSQTGAKAGLSDPTVLSGKAVAQRIKVTLGIKRIVPSFRKKCFYKKKSKTKFLKNFASK